MQTTTLNLYSLGYSQAKTYLIAAAFVVGNILLPQLAHTVPQGGFIFLPIYFFTLVAAYKYGWKAGLLTAVLSPVVNHLLFGMPPLAVLPAILLPSPSSLLFRLVLLRSILHESQSEFCVWWF